jgi:hypothetical protein
MAKEDLITHRELLSILDYNAETGVFTWLVAKSRRLHIGDVAGTINNREYRMININLRLYCSHRLAWFYVYKEWPKNQIDHINGIKDDNRISNLRLATNAENNRNKKITKSNTSGYKGVHWNKRKNKWDARIGLNKKRIRIGRFDCPKKAHEAYCEAAEKLHGEFSKAG